MLIGVEAHSVRVNGHVGEINASIFGTLDRTAVGAATDLAVLHRAANVNNVRSAWRRVDRHVVRALRCAVAERGETRSSVRMLDSVVQPPFVPPVRSVAAGTFASLTRRKEAPGHATRRSVLARFRTVPLRPISQGTRPLVLERCATTPPATSIRP